MGRFKRYEQMADNIEHSENITWYIPKAKLQNLLAQFRPRNEHDNESVDKLVEHVKSQFQNPLAVNFSPSNKVLRDLSTIEIYELLHNYLQKYLYRLIRQYNKKHNANLKDDDIKIMIVFEYSSKGRWHGHGLIQSPSGEITAQICRYMKRRYGRFFVEDIRYLETYISYMFKSFIDGTRQLSKQDIQTFNIYIPKIHPDKGHINIAERKASAAEPTER